MEDFLKIISEDSNKSGYGYYTTYVGPEFVIKEYEIEPEGEEKEIARGFDTFEELAEFYEEDIQKHKDLDGLGLLPKLLATFKKGRYAYIVVDKAEVFIMPLSRSDIKGSEYDSLYHKIYVEQKKSVHKLCADLKKANYSFDDFAIFNVGMYKGRLVCIDEGAIEQLI